MRFELAAEQDQRGERQHVGIDRPLQIRRARIERPLDRRQGDVHDRVVEHDHEEREAHGEQRPPLVVWVIVRHQDSSISHRSG
jgi:hypothetical protein